MKNYMAVMSRKTKWKCAGVIVLALISSILTSVWPVQLGEIYTEISAGSVRTLRQGMEAVAAFGLIYLTAECITIFRRVMLDCIIAGHEAEVREYSVGKLLKMPVSYYSGSLSGEKTAQLNQGVAGFSQLIRILCNDVFAAVLTAACTLVQVFLNAPGLMAGLMMLYLVITILISAFQIHSQNGVREEIVRQKNSLDGQICQSISNLELIRSMHAEQYEKNRLRPEIGAISRTEKRHHRYMGSFDCLKQAVKIAFQVLLLILSIVMISRGNMAPGAVITVCLLFQQLVKPIDDVYRFMDETASSLVKAKALMEVYESPEDTIFDVKSGNEKTCGSQICLRDVLITNPEKEKTLAWYEKLTIPCDRIVALKGESGCGKTTLIRSLNRYYPHIQGEIRLFGRDQESYSQTELTSLLYYSPQTSFFVAGTVRDNLIYGLDREVSEEELIRALHEVSMTGTAQGALCDSPAEALNFQISENASELSGGMKQRLALARAFLRKPKVFIFDEITANLDSQAVEEVLSNIEAYAREHGAGIIYISHDKKVIDRCDEVIPVCNKVTEHAAGKEAA